MKGRLTRWIGLGLMALAALTMVAGDVFAAPARTGSSTTARASFTLRFDLFSPGDVTCSADAPNADVRSGRDFIGRPYIRVTGDLTGAVVTCAEPGGARWQTDLPRDSREPLAVAIDGLVLWRKGAKRVPLLVRADRDRYSEYEYHSFTRLP